MPRKPSRPRAATGRGVIRGFAVLVLLAGAGAALLSIGLFIRPVDPTPPGALVHNEIRLARGYVQLGRSGATHFVTVPPTASDQDLWRAAAALTGSDRAAHIIFWADPIKAANHFPLTDQQERDEIAIISIDKSRDLHLLRRVQDFPPRPNGAA